MSPAVWMLLAGCQEPFAVDRHDLVGFRIAAVSAPPGAAGAEIEPLAAFVVDDHLWSPEPLDLAWYWVPTGDDDAVRALDPLSEAAGAGPSPTLTVPVDQRRLVLIARRDRDELRAFVDLPEGAPVLPRFGQALSLGELPLRIDSLEGPELLRDARLELDEEPAAFVAPGRFARLSLVGVPEDLLVRWMATAGTFFELEPTVADWAPGDVRLDDDELDAEPTALDPGPVSVIALQLAGTGEARFTAGEIWVGEPGPGLWVGGRWLPTSDEVLPNPGVAVRGTLQADDDSPTGVRLDGPTQEPLAGVTDWGTPALSCLVSRDGPFDPNWLLTQICGRDGVVGHEVAVVPDGTP